MTITKTTEGNALTVMLEGRLDTVTTPELEKELMGALDDIQELTFDFEKLSYISSAGLRVLLSSQKIMNTKGTMKVVHVNENIMDIFEATGFTDVLTIE
ncbi:MAG: STAS domain-containing protein [Lachnospiraceae bacterium]|jgi:anti-sigma B factor antagonist|nr:STAS domain-containing protein [Lachnospiraceae bacterium]